MNPFTEHPHQQGTSYAQHWYFAMGIARRLAATALRFALHAMLPAIAIERRFDLEATIDYLHQRNDWIENAGITNGLRTNTVDYHVAKQPPVGLIIKRVRLFQMLLISCMVLAVSIPAYLTANDRLTGHTMDVIDISDVKVKFRIKVLGLARINGVFNRFSGYIVNDEKGNPSGVSMRIDVGSINTNDDDRDILLLGRGFFEVERYPHITFEGKCSTQSADGQMRLIGELNLRGHTRRVVFDILEIESDNGVYSYMAKTRIKRSDFGLNTLKHLVSDDVEIFVDL